MNEALLSGCRICPRECGVNRYKHKGFCQAPVELKINLAQLHYGEEPPISGTNGSGTVFFSHCNLRCVFCQNYVISREGHGHIISETELVDVFLDLEKQGAHNLNLVTPTQYSPQIKSALELAKQKGLGIPVLWNSSAYEKVDTLQSLEGLVDIYLPDYKYAHGIYAGKYSHAADYPEVAFTALKEMYRQVGHLRLNANSLAESGMMIRLLVLPHGLAGTKMSLKKIFYEFGPNMALSLMAQYYPAADAPQYPELSRGVLSNEYQELVELASELGFQRVYVQRLSSDDLWTPKFQIEDNTVSQTISQGKHG
ncbi:MAG: radical SAM protein [Candidatus Cloacimonetes bacterium]|nr:radical SAM protein [Candidatus Cloacimonadota bacterium]